MTTGWSHPLSQEGDGLPIGSVPGLAAGSRIRFRQALTAMDGQAIARLAREILNVADGSGPPWTKKGKEREKIARRTVDLRVPMDDLRKR
jgi:hypothetical protein